MNSQKVKFLSLKTIKNYLFVVFVKYKVNTEYDTIKYLKNNFFCFTF